MNGHPAADTSVTLLAGRYRLGQVIGRGGSAAVYRATDESLGREVALKLFPPGVPDTEELRRYEGEIQVLAQFNHPSLVTLYDAGMDSPSDGEPRTFLTMELIDGQDLGRRLRQGPLPAVDTAGVGADLAAALHYVHSRGVIHRDVKPANILLAADHSGVFVRPKLADFGIARIIEGTRLTVTGATVGTAGYLSPEQATGSAVGPASDIYSLGLVLLECLTGQTEYPGSAVEAAVARLHRSPRVPPDLGPEWVSLLSAMTAMEPQDRPPAADVSAGLREAFTAHLQTSTSNAADTTEVLPAPLGRAPRPGTADASTRKFLLAESGHGGGEPVSAQRGRGECGRAQAGRGEDGRAESGREPGPGPFRSFMQRRAVWLSALAIVVLMLAVLTAGFLQHSVPQFPPPPSYPTVPGNLGTHLSELESSVAP
ncbi:serine/threonine protein kinase [Paenarthrobacter sp. Z7-10]|uniref:serine/threonine-protein kinase n=1 Tax=Paenarthrobacter sp. Z7-10 TaxID=2787635 RepID=UPI0022A95151|nr:serine/threonine-protein kinase [Paenarthrobacter sp. Z7-10]MCZ2402562.1 serine/threonine protein kinase [Paenarthrobacter sp. Z7-10]